MRAFLTTVAVSALTCLFGVAALNLLVDPYQLFPATALAALEPARPVESRVISAEQVRAGKAQALLLGTSRCATAIPEQHAAYGGRQTLKVCLNDSGIYEAEHVLRYAASTNPLRKVWLFLDFHGFHLGRAGLSDFDQSRFSPAFNRVEYSVEKLIGLRVFYESFKVLRMHLRHDGAGAAGAIADERAAADAPATSGTPAGAAKHVTFQAVLESFATNPLNYANFQYHHSRLDNLRNILRLASDAGIELELIELPVHATLLEIAHAKGLWPVYAQWLSDVVDVAGEQPAPVRFFSFTAYDPYTTEPVPTTADDYRKLVWFRDPSHANPELGDKILSSVTHAEGDTAEYGTLLSRARLPSFLSELRAARTRWLAERPQDARWVTDFVHTSR